MLVQRFEFPETLLTQVAIYPVIPNTKVFLLEDPSPHIRIQAHVTSITPNYLTLSKAFPEYDIPTQTLPFDYAIYSLGAQLPRPLNLWATASDSSNPVTVPKDVLFPIYNGEKSEGIAWLAAQGKVIESSPTVLVVGGGALGIRKFIDNKT